MDQHPNMAIIPVIQIITMQTDTIIPLIIINLSTESIFLSKCKVLGFLEQVYSEICEIMTSSASEPLALEVTVEYPENPLPQREGQFICSTADVSVHRKVDLHVMEVSENIQEKMLRPLY